MNVRNEMLQRRLIKDVNVAKIYRLVVPYALKLPEHQERVLLHHSRSALYSGSRYHAGCILVRLVFAGVKSELRTTLAQPPFRLSDSPVIYI